MTDASRFEPVVLRPLQFAFLLAGLVCLLSGNWWPLAGCVAGVFYLGIIGSKLHPLQSASTVR